MVTSFLTSIKVDILVDSRSHMLYTMERKRMDWKLDTRGQYIYADGRCYRRLGIVKHDATPAFFRFQKRKRDH